MEFLEALKRQKWRCVQGFGLTFLLALLWFMLESSYLGWLSLISLAVTIVFIISIIWCPLADITD